MIVQWQVLYPVDIAFTYYMASEEWYVFRRDFGQVGANTEPLEDAIGIYIGEYDGTNWNVSNLALLPATATTNPGGLVTAKNIGLVNTDLYVNGSDTSTYFSRPTDSTVLMTTATYTLQANGKCPCISCVYHDDVCNSLSCVGGHGLQSACLVDMLHILTHTCVLGRQQYACHVL